MLIKAPGNNASKREHVKGKPPIIYIYTYFKLREATKKIHTFPYLPTADVLRILRIIMRVPKKMNYPILHDMENYGLICKINHQRFYISDKKYCKSYIGKIKDLVEYEFW